MKPVFFVVFFLFLTGSIYAQAYIGEQLLVACAEEFHECAFHARTDRRDEQTETLGRPSSQEAQDRRVRRQSRGRARVFECGLGLAHKLVTSNTRRAYRDKRECLGPPCMVDARDASASCS